MEITIDIPDEDIRQEVFEKVTDLIAQTMFDERWVKSDGRMYRRELRDYEGKLYKRDVKILVGDLHWAYLRAKQAVQSAVNAG